MMHSLGPKSIYGSVNLISREFREMRAYHVIKSTCKRGAKFEMG